MRAQWDRELVALSQRAAGRSGRILRDLELHLRVWWVSTTMEMWGLEVSFVTRKKTCHQWHIWLTDYSDDDNDIFDDMIGIDIYLGKYVSIEVKWDWNWGKSSTLSSHELDDYHVRHIQACVSRSEQVRSWFGLIIRMKGWEEGFVLVLASLGIQSKPLSLPRGDQGRKRMLLRCFLPAQFSMPGRQLT